ncbi:MAG TPA: glycosyltransferase family 39 protein [Candidatus Binataceae bacterium]|nr:glycosyltransferase family 39 protein [Candidatus Binataceae bacterium]
MQEQDNCGVKPPGNREAYGILPRRLTDNSAHLIWLGGILIVTAIVYVRSLGNEFIFDDHFQIASNRFIGEWSYFWKSFVNDAQWFENPNHLPVGSYYRPLQGVWLAINFHLFGANPVGWHVVSIALHLIVVCQVFRVAKLLSENMWTGLLSAALFALMPVHVQTVVWPSASQHLLATGCQLGAFEIFARRAAGERSASRFAFAMVLYACALLSHEMAVAFPVLIATYALIFPQQCPGESNAESVADRVRAAAVAACPFATEAAVYLTMRFCVLGFITRPNPLNHHSLSALQVAATIPEMIWIYLSMLVMPWRTGMHRLDIVNSIASPDLLVPVFSLILAGVAMIFLFRRDPRRKLYLFCAAWVLIPLGPALNLNGLYAAGAIQDPYLYFASFGFCVIVSDLAVRFARQGDWQSRSIWAAAAAAAVWYAALSFSLEGYWHDDVTAFKACIEQVPGMWFCHKQLGAALEAQGDFTGARNELENTIGLDPDADAEIFRDLIRVNQLLGDRKAAASAMTESIERTAHPQPQEYAALALERDAAGDEAGAAAALNQAEALPGGMNIAALARAQLLYRHGDRKRAADALEEILRRNPSDRAASRALEALLRSDTAK